MIISPILSFLSTSNALILLQPITVSPRIITNFQTDLISACSHSLFSTQQPAVLLRGSQMASFLCSQPSNTFTADSDSNSKPFSLSTRSCTIWTLSPHSHHSSHLFLFSVTQLGQVLSVLALLMPSTSTFTRLALANFRSWLKSYLSFKAFSDHP